MGFADGCGFKLSISILRKTIGKADVMKLLAEGSTDKLSGFISKKGKPFDARLVLKDGAAVFSFD